MTEQLLTDKSCPHCKDGIVKRHVQFGAIQRCKECNGHGVIKATHKIVPIEDIKDHDPVKHDEKS